MVVLPAEKRFDWKYPPVMLFTIIALNILVFFLYQSSDDDKFDLALSHYEHSGLLRMEWPAYQNYLRSIDEETYLKDVQEQYLNRHTADIIYAIVNDDDFIDYLDSNGKQLLFNAYDESDNWDNWRHQRDTLDDKINQLSFLAYGLIPKDLNPITLLSHQFLHGDAMHLLGNMTFLIICGFAVEAAIGAWFFLALYLAAGVAGGLFFALLDLQSGIPLVGASGAISGVMAMYLAIFRLRKIDFFYWIFIFAGYFRAPALLILPLYIGKEVFSFVTNEDSNVAFMAHAGGFICGGLLILAAHYKKPDLINNEYVEQDQSVDPEQQALAKIYHLLDQMKFAAALKLTHQHIINYKLNFELAYLRYHLAKVLNHKDLPVFFGELMTLRSYSEPELKKLAKAWRDNPTLHCALEEKTALKLALNFTTEDYVLLAEEIFERFYNPQSPNSSLGIVARKLSVIFTKINNREKQQRFSVIADQFITGAL